jgi:hypothetical protein
MTIVRDLTVEPQVPTASHFSWLWATIPGDLDINGIEPSLQPAPGVSSRPARWPLGSRSGSGKSDTTR